jgi:hypothetical protein
LDDVLKVCWRAACSPINCRRRKFRCDKKSIIPAKMINQGHPGQWSLVRGPWGGLMVILLRAAEVMNGEFSAIIEAEAPKSDRRALKKHECVCPRLGVE